jgi:sulfur-oxidizing protein SoxY
MQTRRETLKQSALVAGMLAAAGFPQFANAAYNKAAFDAKTLQEVVKALGAGAVSESKDVTITGPDIAENGAVVPLSASTSLSGVKQMLVLVEKNPAAMTASMPTSQHVQRWASLQMCTLWPSWLTARRCSPRKKSKSLWVAAAVNSTHFN